MREKDWGVCKSPTEQDGDVLVEGRHLVEHLPVDLLDLVVDLHHVRVGQPVKHLLVVELVAWLKKSLSI